MNTRDVVRFVTHTKYDDLPPQVVDQAKHAVRDTLAVALAAHDDMAVQAARAFAINSLSGPKQATILGSRVKVPCVAASLVNAVMASTLDMDDAFLVQLGNADPRGHAGCVVVPASLSIAEWRKTTGKQFLEAVVVGYEVAIRVQCMMSLDGCLQMSGAIDAYGAAAAAAKLLGLDEMQTAHALGICDAHCPHPPMDTLADGMAMTKEGCGWGAMTGVSAALLAEAGFEGPPTIFDLPKYNEMPVPKLGAEWGIMSNFFKVYAACGGATSAIDGVFELVRKHKLKASDIATVRVEGVPRNHLIKQRPASTWQAQFSIPFLIGAAIVDGEVGPEQIAQERLDDPAIVSIAQRVQVLVDKEIGGIPVYGRFASRVTMETVRGERLETLITVPSGMFDKPQTQNELEMKFTRLVTKVLGIEKTKSLNEVINRLERHSVKDLVSATTAKLEM